MGQNGVYNDVLLFKATRHCAYDADSRNTSSYIFIFKTTKFTYQIDLGKSKENNFSVDSLLFSNPEPSFANGFNDSRRNCFLKNPPQGYLKEENFQT